jgi:hypothetical protein
MATRKKSGGAFFEGHKFAKGLEELIDLLPSDSDRQQVVSQLETLIQFLSSVKTRLESIPTKQDAEPAHVAVEKLQSLFAEAQSNPVLGAALGIKATAPRQRPAAVAPEEVERAKLAIARFESLPIDQLRVALDGKNVRDLQVIAHELGITTTKRTAREALAHQVATKIDVFHFGIDFLCHSDNT